LAVRFFAPPPRDDAPVNPRSRDRYADAPFLNGNLAVAAKDAPTSVLGSNSRRTLRKSIGPTGESAEAPTKKRSKTMRLMTITKVFAISAVLLSGTAAYAAREPDHGTGDICREQPGEFCRPSPFTIQMPGARIGSQAGSVSAGQARANARSRSWPGDMILD
jgi:hypothetical protein